MNKLNIELIPLRNAISWEVTTTFDLIIRITPPARGKIKERCPLNLGLVIDRSGSMSGEKLKSALQAARFLILQLLPTDRLSVVSYDNKVETLVPNTLIENKESILEKINALTPGHTTALHEGWVEGATQVSQYLQPEALNRVLLLSDGLANVGETNPDVIATNVRGLAEYGVSTSTLGIGDDYNEDLMEAMANSGEGNYYYIENPASLETIFQNELRGLMATVGQKVTLNLTPQTGIILEEVFNDFETNTNGDYKLPNLVIGNELNIAVRFKVPPTQTIENLFKIRLNWQDLNHSQQQEVRALDLPSVSKQELDNYPFNAEVREKVIQLQTARAKEEAIRSFDQKNYAAAQKSLEEAKNLVESAPIFDFKEVNPERDEIEELKSHLNNQEDKKFRKKASYQSYNRRRGQSSQ